MYIHSKRLTADRSIWSLTAGLCSSVLAMRKAGTRELAFWIEQAYYIDTMDSERNKPVAHSSIFECLYNLFFFFCNSPSPIESSSSSPLLRCSISHVKGIFLFNIQWLDGKCRLALPFTSCFFSYNCWPNFKFSKLTWLYRSLSNCFMAIIR